MSAFQRQQRRFVCQGINVVKAFDDLPPGKYGFLQNVRSYIQGEITSRNGLVSVANIGAAIHSIERFDDATPFGANPHLVFIGAGANVYAGPPGGLFPQVDTGYSGNPLSLASATPPNSPQPWLYAADSARYRKFDANGHVYGVGLAPPTAAPDVRNATGQLGINIIGQFQAAFVPWVSAGVAAGPLNVPVQRTNTTISQIIYDSIGGTPPGYASIVPVDFTGIAEGELLLVNGSENVAITQVTIAVATTTIAGIVYDVGTTGLCTIQPAASLGVGQLDAPTTSDYAARANAAGADTAVPRGTAGALPEPTPSIRRIRQMDFPVNCLVSLGNAETVRILSVALGPDGIQSFRCIANSPHAAGESIVGLAAFRVYLVGNYAAGVTLQDKALANTVTSPVPLGIPPVAQSGTGGVRTGAGFAPLNLALINGRPTLPDDDVHLCVRFDKCPSVNTIRLYLSLEPTAGSAPSATDFTQNYYFFEWRATDIIAAIQGQNADTVASLQAVQPTIVGNAQLNASPVRGHTQQPGSPLNTAQSSVIAAGNLQWLELRCKIGDLQRIGTDPSKTLANVTAAEVLVNVQGTTGGAVGVQVAYDAIWISGGFGPDVGATASPYVYRARYRSSITGAVSNPSPASLGGVIPRRQRVSPTLVASTDPQVDLIDWFRLGATLSTWTYIGTGYNAAPTFNDDYPDTEVVGGIGLSFTEFQPWPTQDLPRRGTCNVVGSAIVWISGDQFNTQWAPGSTIIVNNKPYTLYAQPGSATRLFINENAGVSAGATFTLPGPTLLGQLAGSIWGGAIGGATFLFACRDTTNPGQVHWTNGNNSEASQEANTLDVTSASEPLQNGFMYDGLPYVASTDQIYLLNPSFGATASFQPLVTPCGRGFWTPWAFALAPEGVYFLAKDGIYLSAGGGVGEPITDDDLYPLFPHDGVPGVDQPTHGVFAPDLSQTNNLRLAYVDGWLYFDHKTSAGTQTLAYRRSDKSWWVDTYPDGVTCRTSGTGYTVHTMLVGASNSLCTSGGITDLGQGINCKAEIVDNQADARRQKLYRDFMVDASQATPITITLGFTNNNLVIAPLVIAGIAGRFQYPLSNASLQQTGVYGTNITALLAWTPIDTATILFAWDLAFQPGPELSTNWLSGPTTHGLTGFQQVPRVRLAYISTAPATFSVIIDGVLYTYNLPSSGGLYAKKEIVLQSVKGMTFQYGLTGAAFQLFDSDVEVLVQPWGGPGGYQNVRPF